MQIAAGEIGVRIREFGGFEDFVFGEDVIAGCARRDRCMVSGFRVLRLSVWGLWFRA